MLLGFLLFPVLLIFSFLVDKLFLHFGFTRVLDSAFFISGAICFAFTFWKEGFWFAIVILIPVGLMTGLALGIILATLGGAWKYLLLLAEKLIENNLAFTEWSKQRTERKEKFRALVEEVNQNRRDREAGKAERLPTKQEIIERAIEEANQNRRERFAREYNREVSNKEGEQKDVSG